MNGIIRKNNSAKQHSSFKTDNNKVLNDPPTICNLFNILLLKLDLNWPLLFIRVGKIFMIISKIQHKAIYSSTQSIKKK